MSGTVLWIMCVAIVVSLAIWLTTVALAQRTPYFRHPDIQPRRGGRVSGGIHTGDGRSVMPPRDEPASVTGLEEDSGVPDTGVPDTGIPDTAGRDYAGRSRGKSGSPLDL